MLAITLGCGLLIPHININSDLTEYLPSESGMKHGIDTLKANFPFIDTNAPTVRAMFPIEDASDSLAKELQTMEGIVTMLPERRNDSHILYTLNAAGGISLTDIQEQITSRHPDAVVETNANSNMPDNMGLILMLGAALVAVILLVMCSSFMEVLLFIFTIGMAVIMNMGTNAFLPSVSMMTNTIVALLQFVLSMDYSIILMNRYRLVRKDETDSALAMKKAMRLSRSSILSSSLTTIVGLLALVFMKFRIGLDLGVVLAKGVLFSLISIYTILPGLVLVFEKAINATTKKVPVIPTTRLAVYEVKFRWVLAVVFFALFAGSQYLQTRTELAYASIWESEIDDVFAPQTNVMLLYRTEEEDNVIALLDSVSASDPKVVSAVSYPSVMERAMSAGELFSKLEGMKDMLPGGDIDIDIPVDSSLLTVENLKALYYLATHPERNEKASFDELLACLPPQIDAKAFSDRLLPQMEDEDEKAAPEPEVTPVVVEKTDSVGHVDTLLVENTAIAAEEAPSVQEIVRDTTERFTYENVRQQMDAAALAGFLGFGEKNAQTIFRMAGRHKGTMSPKEFVNYVNTRILSNKLLSGAISKKDKEGLSAVSRQIDSVLASGPRVEYTAYPRIPRYAQETSVPEDTLTAGLAVKPETVETPPVTVAVQPSAATPYDELLEMAGSGKRYTAGRVGRALRRAGIDIPQEAVDLLFAYYGSKKYYDDSTKLSVNDLLDFASSMLEDNEFVREMAGEKAASMLSGLRQTVEESLGMLRSDVWSFAAIVYESLPESEEVFSFVERLRTQGDNLLQGSHFLIGESVMYKEMKDGFRRELLAVTLLTIAAIFLIVCISFKSLIIPIILIMAVLTGVFVNVWASGLGGNRMLYLAYLIVQSILMGATIDYAIVFTNFYRENRFAGEKKVQAMRLAYKGSINTIMTSGLIMILAPYVLSVAMSDPTIKAILSSLTFGALAVSIIIIFILPGTLAACDKIICRKK